MDRSNCKECKGKGWSRQTLAYGVKVNEPCELCELRPAETQEPVSMTSETVVPDPRACDEMGYDYSDVGDMMPVVTLQTGSNDEIKRQAEAKRTTMRAIFTVVVRKDVIRLRQSLRDSDSEAFMASNYITHKEQEDLDKAMGSLATAAIYLDRLAVKLHARAVGITRKETT